MIIIIGHNERMSIDGKERSDLRDIYLFTKTTFPKTRLMYRTIQLHEITSCVQYTCTIKKCSTTGPIVISGKPRTLFV